MSATGVIFSCAVNPEKQAAFEAELATLHAQVHANEPKTLVYEFCKDTRKPGTYFCLEIYTDDEALKKHGETAYFQEFFGKLKGFVSNKPQVQVFKTIGPSGKKQIVDKATVAIVADIPIKKGKEKEFEAVTMPLIDKVQQNEDGNLLYQLMLNPKNSGSYAFMEFYTDMKAVASHGKTEYFKAAGKKQAPYMAGKPQITFLQPLFTKPMVARM